MHRSYSMFTCNLFMLYSKKKPKYVACEHNYAACLHNLSYMIGQKYATLKFIYSPVVKHFDRISLHNVAV